LLRLDPKISHANVDDLKSFPLNDDDVVVVGYPKSGTNWLQIMLANLWGDWTTLNNERRQVPNLAGKDRPGYSGYLACIAVDSPRLMKSHLPIDMMPARWPDHGKVVHITRNPKDVCVSYYHETRAQASATPGSRFALPEDFPMRDYVRLFVDGQVQYGRYTDNVIGWRHFEHPNLLKITYEDARWDVRSILDQVTEFIGKPVSCERVDEVIAKTEFSAMKWSDLRFQVNHPDLRENRRNVGPFMRKGVVGDWKEQMSTADSEYLDATVVAQLEREGIFLTYALPEPKI
jgi:hypothetical protein